MTEIKYKIIPFGGLGEIGKNMMAIETPDQVVVVDCGLQFPSEDLKGVDLIIPDVQYLMDTGKPISVLITHGHEDHIGALRFLESVWKCRIYAPKFAALLLNKETKFKNEIIVVNPKTEYQITDDISALWFSMSHSIPDSMGICLETPLGKMIHTGDFKLDFEDNTYQITDRSYLERLGQEDVTLLMSDSTYAEIPGITESEDILEKPLDDIIKNAPGRCIFSTFSSLIRRVQRIIDIAERYNKKVCFVGRSMIKYTDIAFSHGYLKAQTGTVVNLKRVGTIKASEAVIVMTGSQGEPRSALVRLANNDLDGLSLERNDTVILSSGVIPGNEKKVSDIINKLVGNCENVVYEPLQKVHVHGHAARDELSWVINTIKPKYFVPIHGEHKHLVQHHKIAQDAGLNHDRAFLMLDGDIGALDSSGFRIEGKLVLKEVWTKGRRMYDGCAGLQKERDAVSNSGLCVININVTRQDELRPECLEFGVVRQNDKTSFTQDIEMAIHDKQDEILRLIDNSESDIDLLDEFIRNIIYKMYQVYPKLVCNVVFS